MFPGRQTTPPQLPTRPVLYFFEHYSLRESAFNYDRDIQALIANPRQSGKPVGRIFAKAVMRAAVLPNFNKETVLEDMQKFMQKIGFDTTRQGGFTIHLMRMPPPEFPNEAYFIAIVYKDDEPLVEGKPAPSTRYFTFEKTHVEGRAFAFGEWNANGQYKTHGFGNQEPTIRDFIGNVLNMLGLVADLV